MGLLTISLILMAVGVIIVAGGFLFAVINWTTAVHMTESIRSASTEFGRSGRMFRRHAAAMVVIVVGGLLAFIGTISAAYLALTAVLAP